MKKIKKQKNIVLKVGECEKKKDKMSIIQEMTVEGKI